MMMETTPPKQVWLFTGQGAQYVGMGQAFYQHDPVFREALDECAELLTEWVDTPLMTLLYGDDVQLIDKTEYTQPALFAIEYALSKMWQSHGLQPDLLMGHSLGEYAAACVAGVFSLKDALKLVSLRGRYMKDLCQPALMLGVKTDADTIQRILSEQGNPLVYTAMNGPDLQVIGGLHPVVEAFKQPLEQAGLLFTELAVSHAFHTPLVEPMLAAFSEVLDTVAFHLPAIPIVSNLTGKHAGDEITTKQYWLNHINEPVQFTSSMQTILQEQNLLMLEIGPKPVLTGLGRRVEKQLDSTQINNTWLVSLDPKSDSMELLQSNLDALACYCTIERRQTEVQLPV